MNRPKLAAACLLALVVGFLIGGRHPYAIVTSANRMMKINQWTGRSWVYHTELGQWVEITDR